MRRLHDNLQRIVRLKEQMRNQQKLVVLKCQTMLSEASHRLQRLEEELKTTSDYVRGQLAQDNHTSLWSGLMCGCDLEFKLKQAHQRLAETQSNYDEAARHYHQLSIQVESLNLIRRKRQALHRQQAARRSQKQADDMALTRWSKSRRNAKEVHDA